MGHLRRLVPVSGHPGLYDLQIVFMVTKGNHNWSHRVTIEGTLEDETRALCWVARHLRSAHGLDLLAMDTWDLSPEGQQEQLWSLSKDSMR